MPVKDEELALVSILSEHPATVLPYLRLSYYKDLFQTQQKAALWVADYFDKHGVLPKIAQLKKQFPRTNTLVQAEPIAHAFAALKELYVETIASNIGQKMSDALTAKDIDAFVKFSQELVTKVDQTRRAVSSSADDTNDFVEQLGLELDRDAAQAMKVMPTGFAPFDDEDGGGMRPGHLYVLASLVNLGKTYVSLQQADNIRKNGFNVLYVSTEMPSQDLKMRHLAIRFGLNVDQLIRKEQPQSSIDLKEDKLVWFKSLLQDAQTKIEADTAKGKLYIVGCDDGFLTPRQIRSEVEEKHIDAVFIDAAQDIRDDAGTKDRTPALYNALAQLNEIARTKGVAIYMTVQLDPEVEKKGLSQGNLNRIQWAQVFAQKAHIVMSMLGKRDAAFRDMTIEKSRDGKAGRKFWLNFKFPEVVIEATSKAPGSIDELDEPLNPVSTISELQQALKDADEEEEEERKATPPPGASPVRKAPTRFTGALPAGPVTNPLLAPQAQAQSPYAIRQSLKALKKGKK